MSGTAHQSHSHYYYGPNMSDTTILIKLDDLIALAIETEDKSVVNFKLVQTILYALARQMRMLEQQVEVRLTEVRFGRDDDGGTSAEEDLDDDRKPSDKRKAAKSAKGKEKSERRTNRYDDDDAIGTTKSSEKSALKREKTDRQTTKLEGMSRETDIMVDRKERKEKRGKEDRSIKKEEQDTGKGERGKGGSSKDRNDTKDQITYDAVGRDDKGQKSRTVSSSRKHKGDEEEIRSEQDKDRPGRDRDRKDIRDDKFARKQVYSETSKGKSEGSDKDKFEEGRNKSGSQKKSRIDRDTSDRDRYTSEEDRDRSERSRKKSEVRRDESSTQRDESGRSEKDRRLSAESERKTESSRKEYKQSQDATEGGSGRSERARKKSEVGRDRLEEERDRLDEDRGQYDGSRRKSEVDRDGSDRNTDESRQGQDTPDKEGGKLGGGRKKSGISRDTSQRDSDKSEESLVKSRGSRKKSGVDRGGSERSPDTKEEREGRSEGQRKKSQIVSQDRKKSEVNRSEPTGEREDQHESEGIRSRSEKSSYNSEAPRRGRGKTERDDGGPEDEPASKEKSGGRVEKSDESRVSSKQNRGRVDDDGQSIRSKGKRENTAGTFSESGSERQKQKTEGGKSGAVRRRDSDQISRVGSIEVVTHSQFELLKKAVQELQKKAGPLPVPTMPDNKKLMADLAKGTASLPDTMQAMQLTSRMQAAESAIGKMTELLTQLTATGSLPKALADKAAALQREVATLGKEVEGINKSGAGVDGVPGSASGKGVSMMPGAKEGAGGQSLGGASTAGGTSTYGGASTVGGTSTSAAVSGKSGPGMAVTTVSRRVSDVSTPMLPIPGIQAPLAPGPITFQALEQTLHVFHEEVTRIVKQQSDRTASTMENVMRLVKRIQEKVDAAGQLDARLTTVNDIVDEYNTQVAGLGAGLTSQVGFFHDQVKILREELNSGLSVITAFEFSESAALTELKERYQELVNNLEGSNNQHKALSFNQNDLSAEVRALLQMLEMTTEQKADREEVYDALKDKADASRLNGLISEDEFRQVRQQLDIRIQMCYEKFRKQDHVWLEALGDFANATDGKATLLDLISLRETMQKQLQGMDEKVHLLTKILGDPKTAVLCRKIAKDGTCGPCFMPAIQDFRDPRRGGPIRLPSARGGPAGEPAPLATEDICMKALEMLKYDEPVVKRHVCRRWVGGSHTTISEGVTRKRAPATIPEQIAKKRYIGLGSDGKPYKLEEDLLPCVECNQLFTDKIPGEADQVPLTLEIGAGDQVTVVTPTNARRVTIVNDETIRQAATIDHQSSETHHDDLSKDDQQLSKFRSSVISTSDQPTDHKSIISNALYITDDIPGRLTGIGNIVSGRVTVVDEADIRRASIKHERRATLLAAQETKEANLEAAAEPEYNIADEIQSIVDEAVTKRVSIQTERRATLSATDVTEEVAKKTPSNAEQQLSQLEIQTHS